jgi:putative sigma-54 modulation protein
MQVSVTFRNIEATEALKSYARDKVERVQRYINRPVDAHVVLFKERFLNVAEILVTANGVPLKCLARDDDMYAAIDGAIDKLDRQVRKFTEKLKSHRPPEVRRAKRTQRAREEVTPVAPATRAPVIVKTDEFATTPMTPELAVAELQARGYHLLLFKNARTKRVSAVYKRDDGSFALVEGKSRKKKA